MCVLVGTWHACDSPLSLLPNATAAPIASVVVAAGGGGFGVRIDAAVAVVGGGTIGQ